MAQADTGPTAGGVAQDLATALDAAVLLGLVGKAREVFARDGHLLSFPLSLWSFDPVELEAAVNDPLSPAGTRGAARFADLVNCIPGGVLWQPEGNTRLWDVHADVLGAALAKGTRTPTQEAEYAVAQSVLNARVGDRLVDSVAVVAFEEYRDAYISAVQEFNHRHSQAQSTDDPALTAAWERDRDELQEAVDEAMTDWEALGHRAAVRQARKTVRDLAARSPVMVWQGFRKLFDPDLPEIFFTTGPGGVRYVPTGYIPADVVDSAWATMTLTRAELEALAPQAPGELTSRLGASGLDETLATVTFEYSWVTPHRPWFTPDPYHLGCWRFVDGHRLLSDGGDPPDGECPGYVTGLVLIRNVALENRVPAAEPKAPDTPPRRPSRREPRTPRRTRSRRPRRRRTVRYGSSGSSGRPRVRDHRTKKANPVSVKSVITRVTGGIRKVRDHRRPSAPAERVTSRRRPPRTAPRRSSSTHIGGDEIYVLAFESAIFPRCPNPDLNLVW